MGTIAVAAFKGWTPLVNTEASESGPPADAKLNTPTRENILNLIRSMAACSSRLSAVNCWNAPMPALVRTIATRSPGCICWSTNFCRALRTWATLSNDRPRSSTTIANVRLTSVDLSATGGGVGGAGAPFAFLAIGSASWGACEVKT
jgi:hypothetical protein